MSDAAGAAAAAGAGDGGAAAAAAAGGGAAKPWYDGKADAELVGHMQNNGWDKDPVEAAIAAAKSHREAQKKLGLPPDQILRLPKPDAPEAEIKAFHQRLGAPSDPKEYDFSAVKTSDGKDISPEFAEALRASFARRFVPKDTALEIAKDIVKFNDGDAQQQLAAKTAKINEEKAALAAEWKADPDGNMFIAKRGAAALGLTAEQVTALENIVGYAGVMKAMHKVGVLNREPGGLITNDGKNSGAMTREQAIARKADLMRDSAWTKRHYDGDTAARAEMLNLNRIITGDFETAA